MIWRKILDLLPSQDQGGQTEAQSFLRRREKNIGDTHRGFAVGWGLEKKGKKLKNIA